MNHLELWRTKSFHFKETCSNELPPDYGNGCTWTCDDWMANAGESSCDETWSQVTKRHQKNCSSSQEPIKDYCKAACLKCGGYYEIFHFRVHSS